MLKNVNPVFLINGKYRYSLEIYDLCFCRTADAIEVDYIIRPENSYPGGNYGTYGGFDLVLLKLRSKVITKL